jgi:HSP20 family protein
MKENASVSVEDNVLTIEAIPEKSVISDPFFTEFTLRRFYRQFALTEEVDQEKISADLKHGVLTVRLPRAESAKPRKIAINVEA